MAKYNNDAEGIVELPLTPEEIDILRDIYSKFVVELEAQDASRPEALSAIIKVQGDNKKISPFWVLKNFVDIDEFQVIKDGGMILFTFDEDEEEIISPNNDKGGETVKTYECKLSVGEKKVAKSLYSKWSIRGISSGHKDNLCKIGGCKERALRTLKTRGYLEQKGDYYRIISERFEEL